MGLWMNPMILDAHDSRIMYFPAANELWRNSDLTQIPYVFPPQRTAVNWTKLTNVSPAHLGARHVRGAAAARSTYGTTDGALYRLDNPASGQPVPVQLPTDRAASLRATSTASPRIPGTSDKLLVAYPNYGIVSIFASDDGGQHWTAVAGNLEENPDGSGAGPSVRWVAVLYVQNRPVYFAGTSVGLYSTTRFNGTGTVWVKEGASSIGNVVVDMIDVRQSDGYVAVGTHGNGVYTARITSLPRQPGTIRRHLSGR